MQVLVGSVSLRYKWPNALERELVIIDTLKLLVRGLTGGYINPK